jgi:cytochrome c553
MLRPSTPRTALLAAATALLVSGAIGVAMAAPVIPAGSTPPASHVADGRSKRVCSNCHTFKTTPVPTPTPKPVVIGAYKAVPPVVARSGKHAVEVLNAAGFQVWVSHAYSTTVPRYVVIKQTPASGASLRTGRTVTIVESWGRPWAKSHTTAKAVVSSSVPSCVRCHGTVPSGVKPHPWS